MHQKNSNTVQQKRRRKKPAYSKKKKPLSEKLVLGSFRKVQLCYVDGSDQRANAGANFFVWRLRLNDVFDPDPLLLTGGITGYPEMVAIFNRWRVQSVHFKCTVANRESFPIHFGILASPSDMATTITSRALALDALERPYTLYRTELSTQSGMDRSTCTRHIQLQRVLGDLTYHTSGEFDGTASVSPTRFIFLTMVLVAPATSLLPNGIFYNMSLTYHVRFFDIIPKLLGQSEEYYQMMSLVMRRRRLYAAGQKTSLVDLEILALKEGDKS